MEKPVEIGDDISTLKQETLEFDGINIPAAVGVNDGLKGCSWLQLPRIA